MHGITYESKSEFHQVNKKISTSIKKRENINSVSEFSSDVEYLNKEDSRITL